MRRTPRECRQVGPATGISPNGFDPLALRLALLRHHHGQPARIARSNLHEAAEMLKARRARVREWAEHPSARIPLEAMRAVRVSLDDDLDTPAVLGILQEVADDPAVAPGAKFETFVYVDRVLALDLARDLGRQPSP